LLGGGGALLLPASLPPPPLLTMPLAKEGDLLGRALMMRASSLQALSWVYQSWRCSNLERGGRGDAEGEGWKGKRCVGAAA
jgi:hypothetical protein